jgi:hypothetical protein
MNVCNHNDCFTCPYPDCICDAVSKNTTKKRQKLSPEEAKIRKARANKKYYDKNAARISQLHRENYKARKERRKGMA